jgi:CheY-like chemotaxis protein
MEGLSLARKHRPTAISLDVFLPDMLGWTVLNQLKRDTATRHILADPHRRGRAVSTASSAARSRS